MRLDVVVLVLGAVCFAAPVILALSKSIRFPLILAVMLTAAAALLLTLGKGFAGEAVAAAAWLGAMMCGLVAYLDQASARTARILAYRLLKQDLDGIKAPGPGE